MQGSHRYKKSFPLTLGGEEGHEGAEVGLWLLEFCNILDAKKQLTLDHERHQA